MSPSDGANRRRSERVMLRMSVVVETETVQREKLREQTYTLVVNAHGGFGGSANFAHKPEVRREGIGACGASRESARWVHCRCVRI
jgi:hypothetical protein